jgi:predicted amidohydrolase
MLLAVQDGRIVEFARVLHAPAHKVIDAQGCAASGKLFGTASHALPRHNPDMQHAPAAGRGG